MNTKLAAGSPFPEMDLDIVGGGTVRLGGRREGWQLLVVYRGRHCPICKRYLTRLKELAPEYAEGGAEVVALSGDPLEKAAADKADLDLDFTVAHGLSEDQMNALGLYVSDPRSPQETDRRFPEPALFLLTPEGKIQIVDVSNAPFARPDLEGVLNGFRFILKNDYPIRGTAS